MNTRMTIASNDPAGVATLSPAADPREVQQRVVPAQRFVEIRGRLAPARAGREREFEARERRREDARLVVEDGADREAARRAQPFGARGVDLRSTLRDVQDDAVGAHADHLVRSRPRPPAGESRGRRGRPSGRRREPASAAAGAPVAPPMETQPEATVADVASRKVRQSSSSRS